MQTTWAAIKKARRRRPRHDLHSRLSPRRIGNQPQSGAEMQMSVSADPVNAPIFYRDVPLMPSETEKGFIKPLADSAHFR